MLTEADTSAIKARLDRVEQIQNGMVKEHYALDAEIKVIMNQIGYIKDGQDSLSQGINKVLWAIGISIITAVMAFVINGGLST
jgi:hypothetical protein